MQYSLINVLIDRGLIVNDMIVTGKVLAKSLGNSVHYVTKELRIVAIMADRFQCLDRIGASHQMLYVNVSTVDGMDLDRFAAVYNIKADGSDKAQGKKRGRKPKSAQINTLEGDSNGKDKRTESHNKAQQAFA